MSILDSAAEGNTGESSGDSSKSVDQLNKDFQSATGTEGEGQQNDGKTAEASWYYDANIPGTGERPEFLKDKYKSLAEQAKAYNELDKKLGQFKGAPETYDLTIPDLPDFAFEQGDPVLSEFLEMAKESNASQEFVTKALSHYVKAQNFYAPDPKVEMEKIGLNAKQEIAQLSEWAGQRLDKNEYEVFKSMVTTAETFKVLQKLRRAATSQNEIAADKSTSHGQKQINERQLLEMIADPKFQKDPLYRAEVEAKAQRVWG